MDVNEEIVTIYLKRIKKWFYITDIPYKVTGKKGGKNYGNIDILASDLENMVYDIEVKYRSAYYAGESDLKGLADQLSRKERTKKIKGFMPGNKKIKISRIIVTTKEYLGKSEENRKGKEREIKKILENKGIKKVSFWYFNDLIRELEKNIDIKGRYNTQFEQTVRLLKKLR